MTQAPRLLFIAGLVALSLFGGAPVAAQTTWSTPPAYTITGQGQNVTPPQAYRIAPLDKIDVKVFGQEGLSVEKVEVDAGGQVVLPLIGVVTAAGKTAQELSTEIAGLLGDKYLQSPHVSVLLNEAVGQRVTVTGAVMESGVFNMKGPTTLLQAISMAKGPDPKSADLKQVAIFRVIEGRRARAVFNVDAIRKGTAEDPEIQGGDTVVVANSRSKGVWREVVGFLPSLGVFAWF